MHCILDKHVDDHCSIYGTQVLLSFSCRLILIHPCDITIALPLFASVYLPTDRSTTFFSYFSYFLRNN